MSFSELPQMMVSESVGWSGIDKAHRTRMWYFRFLVLPLALLPPACYLYAQVMHPGVIFTQSVPEPSLGDMAVVAFAFYLAQLAMISYLAMLIRRLAIARDHDPGDDGPYALAAIASTPLWVGSIAMLVPSLGFNLFVLALACAAAVVLIRHGTRPLLHIRDEKTAHYIADVATLAGVTVWFGFLLLAGMVLSVILVHWSFG